MSNWTRDLRHARRALLRTPGFTLLAVGTLALAIGVNTSIFSLVAVIASRNEYDGADVELDDLPTLGEVDAEGGEGRRNENVELALIDGDGNPVVGSIDGFPASMIEWAKQADSHGVRSRFQEDEGEVEFVVADVALATNEGVWIAGNSIQQSVGRVVIQSKQTR